MELANWDLLTDDFNKRCPDNKTLTMTFKVKPKGMPFR